MFILRKAAADRLPSEGQTARWMIEMSGEGAEGNVAKQHKKMIRDERDWVIGVLK